MFEHRSQPLIPRAAFLRRVARCFGAGSALITLSLAIGMLGYHVFEGLSWLDSFLNAAMLMGGMGPIEQPQTTGGKLFAGSYALYCGLVVLIAAAIVFAPVFHRFLHKFHVEKRG